MRKITLTFPYYNNPTMFKYSWDFIRSYPKDIRDNLEVIVIDDGSQEFPMKLPEHADFECRFFRTLVDIPWNNPFCRNLGTYMARHEWMVQTDIDHLVPVETMRYLMDKEFDEEKIYTFERRKVSALNPMALNGRTKPHLFSFFLTKKTYHAIGGCDERTAGYYAIVETDFRNRAGDRLTPLDLDFYAVTRDLINDARTNNLTRKEAPDFLEKRAVIDAILRRRDAGEIQLLSMTYNWKELKHASLVNPGATPENTAVVVILAYENDNDIPSTFGFMKASADRLGIKLHPVMRGQKYVFNEKMIDRSYENKIINLFGEIQKLPENYKYVLYVDARDCLFVRPLQDICDKFNEIGWPILMGASRKCTHHVDPAWQARFGKHKGGFDFLNAGMWMAEREALKTAFCKLKRLQSLVKDGILASSFPPLWNNDQHMWQAAYVEHAFPIRPDYSNEIFNNFHHCTIDEYDFEKGTSKIPVVMKNGAMPCVIHFAGTAVTTVPFFAWCMNLVKPGTIPSKSL